MNGHRNILIVVFFLVLAILVNELIIAKRAPTEESLARLMAKGFIDGCMVAKSKHKASIGVPIDEEQKCRDGAVGYYLMIVEQLEEGE